MSCSIHAIWITNQLSRLLERNPLCSHQDIYDALNNVAAIERDVVEIGRFFHDNEENYETNPTYSGYLKEMNDQFKIAWEDPKKPALKLIETPVTNKWTKRPMASGIFFLDIYRRLFGLDIERFVVFKDGLREDEIDEPLSIYYGSQESPSQNFAAHRNDMCRVIDQIRGGPEGSYRIFNMGSEVSEAFSHWIVVLVRKIGPKPGDLETIYIDAYATESATASPEDQAHFPGWLFQNCIRNQPTEGCPICLGDFDQPVRIPCCNECACASCLQSALNSQSTKTAVQGVYTCPLSKNCSKFLPLNYQPFNHRTRALTTRSGDPEPIDIGECQINLVLGSFAMEELKNNLPNVDGLENWMRAIWRGDNDSVGSWNSLTTLLRKARTIPTFEDVVPLIDAKIALINRINSLLEAKIESIQDRAVSLILVQLLVQKGALMETVAAWLEATPTRDTELRDALKTKLDEARNIQRDRRLSSEQKEQNVNRLLM